MLAIVSNVLYIIYTQLSVWSYFVIAWLLYSNITIISKCN